MKIIGKEILAVDFDGVLCEDRYPEIGLPIIKNINIVKNLQSKKDEYITILWTCRKGSCLYEAIKWCESFDLEFDYVNENCKEIIDLYNGDTRKIYADHYIDDKNSEIDGEYIISKEFKDSCNDFIKELKHMPYLYELYDEVNNPSHYTEGRKFEPAFVINDWGLNWYIGTCIKYLSRMGRKDDSDKEISKALWYIIAEIANNHKDISKEKILKTIDEIYSRKEKYEQLKKE